jgi:hypothetical protein
MEPGLTLISWSAAWLWGVPLIVAVAIFHVSGIWLFTSLGARLEGRGSAQEPSYPQFVLVLGVTVLFVTTMHGLEAAAWAAAYVALNALPDFGTAMLYSLNAITAYGHSSTSLAYHWALMGALEALNGLLMFGLTTAFLFAVAQHVWPISRADKRHYHRLQGRPDQSGCQDHASE